jgi:hypothetical protein
MNTSQNLPTSSNNVDELNRIYRNNTLWEIGESDGSRGERSPPRTRHSKHRSPGSPERHRHSRLAGSPSLRLDSGLENNEFSPHSREAKTIEKFGENTRVSIKSKF